MAKKSSTVHLEQSTWDEIEKYQKENGITGRNDAIERMLLERRLLMNLNIQPHSQFKSKPVEKKLEEKEPEEFKAADAAISKLEEDMPES